MLHLPASSICRLLLLNHLASSALDAVDDDWSSWRQRRRREGWVSRRVAAAAALAAHRVTALERHRLMQDSSAFGARQVLVLADILVKETDDAEANVARRCSSSSNLFCSSHSSCSRCGWSPDTATATDIVPQWGGRRGWICRCRHFERQLLGQEDCQVKGSLS